MHERSKPAFVSILSNTFLVLLKLATGMFIGSIAIIAEALHSAIDLVAAIIAYYSIKKASEPPDEKHKYGHGKIENISGSVEAFLIFAVAIWIIYEAVMAMQHGRKMENLGWGIAVMGISTVMNYFVSAYLFKKAKEYSSPALDADAWHLRTDVYTSLGIFAGLIVVAVTRLEILDPLLAIGVAVLILAVSIKLMRASVADLIDETLPESEISEIKIILDKHLGLVEEYHELRTRKAGYERHIDLHLVLKKTYTLEKAHDICNHLEEEICARFSHTKVLIHLEPCKEKPDCDHDCRKCV